MYCLIIIIIIIILFLFFLSLSLIGAEFSPFCEFILKERNVQSQNPIFEKNLP
jgi:hypothetical protein